MNITLVYSPAARQVRQWHLAVPVATRISEAVLRSGVLQAFTDLNLETIRVGVWGQHANMAQMLKEWDRIEIYRPLRVDPKVARRERFSRQGAKRAGLFASKRVDAKAGYGG